MKTTTFSFLFWCFFVFLNPIFGEEDTITQLILRGKAAVNISSVRLYTDSTFTQASQTVFTEGELFEIVGESKQLHLDDSQTQLFKWYKVKNATNGTEGWIFGDNLALIPPKNNVSEPLQPFFQKNIAFDNGFEKSILWVAHVEGRDVVNQQKAYLNPLYQDQYLVVTNPQGRSVNIQIGNNNESGKKTLQKIQFQDVNQNNIEDIIIETLITPTGGNMDTRNMEIYSFQGGTLAKIWEERLTLTYEQDVPSPALFKSVEIDKTGTIRVAYLDYVLCEEYKQKLTTDTRSKTLERCLEYVTYSFLWDTKKRSFEAFYAPNRSIPTAMATQSLALRTSPNVTSEVLLWLDPSEKVQVVKHSEAYKVNEIGEKKIENWLYVRHPAGVYGYLDARYVQFRNIEQAATLARYYQNPPLMKQDWKE